MNIFKSLLLLPVLLPTATFIFSLTPAVSHATVAVTSKTIPYGTTTKFEGYFVSAKNAKKMLREFY